MNRVIATIRPRPVLAVLALLAALLASLPPALAQERGFVASFGTVPAADGRLPLRQLAATAAAPGPRSRELDPARDWHVRWIGADGETLGTVRVPDPTKPLLGSLDPRQPVAVRFGDRPGAVLVEVRGADGVLRGEIPLDGQARRRAADVSRAVQSRLAAATRRAAKRADVPAAVAAAAARSLQRQVSVQQRLDERRALRCARGRQAGAPEQVVGDPCRDVPVAPAVIARPRTLGVPVGATGRPPAPELRGPLLAPPATKADMVTLTGHLRFPPGSTPPTAPITLYSWGAPGNGSGYVLSAPPPDFAFSSPVAIGADVDLQIVSPAPFLPVTVPLGTITVDTYREITLARGVSVSGRVRFPAGVAPPAEGFPVYFWESGGGGWGDTVSPPDFAFSRAFPPGTMVTLSAQPPAPFIARDVVLGAIDADRTADVAAVRGVAVAGRVSGPANYSVTVRDVVGGSGTRYLGFGTPDFVVGVPPVGAVVEVSADGYFPAAPIVPSGGVDVDVELALAPRPGQNVTLTLKDGTGAPLDAARAEAWRGGRLVTSAVSDAGGIARLELADGTFEIRVWPDTEQANQWNWETTKLFADPAIVAPLAVAGTTAATLAVPTTDWIAMRVALPAEPPYPGCAGPPSGRLELLRDGRVVARGAFRDLYPYAGGGHRLITGGGLYTLRYAMPGGVRYESPPFRATANLTIPLARVGSAPQHLWTGTLRTPAGDPVPDRDIRLGDELGITLWTSCAVRTDTGGRFRVPLCEGCVYSFEAVGSQSAQRTTIAVDTPVTASREQDAILGAALEFAALSDTGKSRVFGRESAPFRLIFLAEGYVAERETFTDTNGNGLWDGVQWVDTDGDGVFDPGEPAATYGAAPWPAPGTDPRAANEPFQDLNADGVLSVDDRALFERNVRDYLRGLFSADEFAAYRGAYQASALMTYSAQAGMDDGPVQRDTLFDATYEPGRGLISIDYGAAQVAAAEAEPGYTVVVVMINQPVPYGRVNSFVLASGGLLGGNVNDNVAGHEFGHNPGGLADEYSEFGGALIGADPGAPNSTRFVDRTLVPWGAHVDPAHDGRPTKPWLARDGFFEGSSYYGSGAFRPSHASMMRFMDSLLFNRASVDQLARVHGRALRDTPGRLTVTGVQRDCAQYRADWDVATLGVDAVELRGATHDGPRLGGGGAAGSAWVKPHGFDLYLVDAADGMVLDIAPVPLLRCTQRAR